MELNKWLFNVCFEIYFSIESDILNLGGGGWGDKIMKPVLFKSFK